jgi:predicted transcriptional regulator
MQDLIKELQRAIRQDGRSLYRLAQDAKLPYAGLHRFVNGKRVGINLVTAAKLLATLGYELRRKVRST